MENNTYLLSGAYKIAVSGEYHIIIGDEGKVYDIIHSSEIISYLIENQCVDVYEVEGMQRVRFNPVVRA